MYSKSDFKYESKSYSLEDAIIDVYGPKTDLTIQDLDEKWTNYESPWNKDGWKMRYSKLYSSKRMSLPTDEPKQQPDRISFLSNESTPLQSSLLIRMREGRRKTEEAAEGLAAVTGSSNRTASILSPRSDSYQGENDSRDLGGHDTMLLNMVRERSREMEVESQEKRLNLPKEETDDDMTVSSEPCMHGLSMRMTERSISRSRISRISTRRDMDIPSILAYTTSNAPGPTTKGIPAFQSQGGQEQKEVPRWSIRRFVCPVCSQKWKDRSSISNVKNSGLKRNSSQDVPSVKASAKLRTSVALGYNPRPALAAVDEDQGIVSGGLRSTSAAWQLTRARRFRAPKPQVPPPESTVPPSVAPLAQKDLDLRVNKFLSDQQV